MDRLSIPDIENAIKRLGEKRTAKYLNTLAKDDKLVQALKTKVGKSLMSALLDDLDRLLKKVVKEDASKEELAEYRVLKKICTKWCDELSTYLKTLNELKGE